MGCFHVGEEGESILLFWSTTWRCCCCWCCRSELLELHCGVILHVICPYDSGLLSSDNPSSVLWTTVGTGVISNVAVVLQHASEALHITWSGVVVLSRCGVFTATERCCVEGGDAKVIWRHPQPRSVQASISITLLLRWQKFADFLHTVVQAAPRLHDVLLSM